MAGLGRKVFNAGEVLSAANVQGYLQDQVVQVYSGTAARSSALGTAVSEGMMSYLTDANELSVYTSNGTAAWSAVNLAQSPNVIINGAFDFWQRGTSVTLTGSAYAVDRYAFIFDGTQSVTTSRQDFTPGNTISGYEAPYYARIAVASTSSGQSYNQFGQLIEDVRTFAGQTMTFSFWAKATSGSFTVTPRYIQFFGSGGSSQVEANFGSTITLTTSWVRYTQTVTLPSISGKTIGTSSSLKIVLDLPKNATWSLDTWGWQVEAGSVATPFRRSSPTLQGELAACQRYFMRVNSGAATNTPAGIGSYYNSTTFLVHYPMKVTMRTAPSLTVNNAASWSVFSNGSSRAASAISLDNVNIDFAALAITTSSATSGNAGQFQTNNTNGSLDLNAEL